MGNHSEEVRYYEKAKLEALEVKQLPPRYGTLQCSVQWPR
jgi:hypothetical protein